MNPRQWARDSDCCTLHTVVESKKGKILAVASCWGPSCDEESPEGLFRPRFRFFRGNSYQGRLSDHIRSGDNGAELPDSLRSPKPPFLSGRNARVGGYRPISAVTATELLDRRS